MLREGLSESELNLLQQSQKNSDNLTKLEKQSFAAVKGLYDDGSGNFTVTRAPDRDFATRLLFSKPYINLKAKIMAPLNQFMNELEERTQTSISNAHVKLQGEIQLAIILIVTFLLCSVAAVIYMRRNILRPLGQLGHLSAEMARGNYTSRSDISMSNELADLGANFNFMAATIEKDITERMQTEVELKQGYDDLRMLNTQLQKAQHQILQSEKMASIGMLTAGVAHEINNPIGYLSSNLGVLNNYLHELLHIIAVYEAAEGSLAGEAAWIAVRQAREKVDLVFLKSDVVQLMVESREGVSRVKKIVQDLKDFSRIDSSNKWQWANLQHGLDATLNIVQNELRYKAEIVKEYGNLPEVECLPSQLNQVFLNILINASHAIEQQGKIFIRTGTEGEQVWIEIEDTGSGIAPENLNRIFDPFFTTKPIGTGTGLGLSLSYGIVQKHRGCIKVNSEPGKGTRFRIWLPIRQPASPEVEVHDQV